MEEATKQKQSCIGTSIDILNDDILDRIFQFLHFDDKIRLRRTCFRWKILLDYQLNKINAFRIGRFTQGGYCITSGLSLNCQDRNHQARNHRQSTSALFNQDFLNFPADLETLCFSINRYDYLHRALKHCHSDITVLSLGQLNITYRLLMVIANNLPNLEHLEIIACASSSRNERDHKRRVSNSKDVRLKWSSDDNNLASAATNSPGRESIRIPSIEEFNSEEDSRLGQQYDVYKMILYNQHDDEQQNMQERLLRSSLLRNCDLVREAKRRTYWPHLEHLLVKDCNLLNEFSLCLIISITSKTLTHLVVESNQYLTGEFLNYCGTNLTTLRLNYCPMIRTKFLDDLVRLKKLVSSDSNQREFNCVHNNLALIQGI